MAGTWKAKNMDQELLFSYFRGETTPQEEERILAWIEASDANRREFRQAHVLFAGLALYASDAASTCATGSGRRWIGRRILRYSVRVAAAVVLVLGAAYFGKAYYHRSLSEQPTRISVPAGQRMQLTLADGTCVQLNSGTTLEYPVVFAREARRVRLSGEAMFEVAPDSEHPFVVETFASDIRVLGTKFNVRADESQACFSTTLVEGRVQVTSRLQPSETLLLEPNDMVTLADGRLYKKRVTDFSDLCWTEGLIHLKKMPFEELMRVFERAFGVRIRIERTTMPHIDVVSGEIRISDGVDYALHVLRLVSSEFTYTRDEKTNEIVIR